MRLSYGEIKSGLTGRVCLRAKTAGTIWSTPSRLVVQVARSAKELGASRRAIACSCSSSSSSSSSIGVNAIHAVKVQVVNSPIRLLGNHTCKNLQRTTPQSTTRTTTRTRTRTIHAAARPLAPSSWLLLPQLRLQEPKSLGSASLNQHCSRFGDPAPVGAAVSVPRVVPGLAPEA